MDIENRFVKMELTEDNHLAIIYNNPYYKGWYKYTLESEEKGRKYTDVVVRFRIPPAAVLYGDVVRQFSLEERIFGLHRFLVGKDLKEEMEQLLKFESINEYIDTLPEDKVRDMMGRMRHMVTLDCNKIPYLHVRLASNTRMDIDAKIKEFVGQHPDYVKMLFDVLNENISIKEASIYSKNTMYNDLFEIQNIKKRSTPYKKPTRKLVQAESEV